MTGTKAKILRSVVMTGSLLALSLASTAQSATGARRGAAHVVALASDTCPSVTPGDKVSLDWNPGFEHPGAVKRLLAFELTFAKVTETGVVGRGKVRLSGGGRGQAPVATTLPNGYFHIELALPRVLDAGEYRVVDADARPVMYRDFGDQPLPKMTVSPAKARFCFTVPPSTSSSEAISLQ